MNYPAFWDRTGPVSLSLYPLSLLFRGAATLRRSYYAGGAARRLPVPVIVIGNITVGGTGKTPFLIWMARLLRSKGYRPGIVSRGYGGSSTRWPLVVSADSDPFVVGDEPVLIARKTQCPVVVGPDRVADAELLLKEQDIDLILSDDGMQHYRLARDAEILIVDGMRRFGNQFCLPAGPLRESPKRARSVDLVVVNGGKAPGEWSMNMRASGLSSVTGMKQQDLEWLSGKMVHAIAGIGHPQRFFALLRSLGAELIEHVFADHHAYTSEDLEFGDGCPLVMTEKDAVKCRTFELTDSWYLSIEPEFDPEFSDVVLEIVRRF